MGWLWTIEKSGNVQFNRNWKPGGIQKQVAILMETEQRDGNLHHEIVQKHSQTNKLYTKQIRRINDRIILNQPNKYSMQSIDAQKSLNPNFNNQMDKPTLKVSKRNGQYLFRMHQIKEKKIGRYNQSNSDIEPVQIVLGRHERHNGEKSSGSSIDLELVATNMFNTLKPKNK
ncbi:uncharacterized protein LOC126898855 [Daktulosphaira vitifoliae]|uniref:uncharacterized protein LOC126898855 n=1 Tax=Daktulosphaira vitifoliae TaxID=58002 RepID=UPI0021A98C7B|nr:uncharacterized protein LOC126898855 [Daktulosphaira vitifoliae]